MTRINTVSPALLSRQHLIAEYREITRVFHWADMYWARPAADRKPLPKTYRLGAGHLYFFYDKLEWITARHHALQDEMRARGYTPTILDPAGPWRDVLPAAAWGSWAPGKHDHVTNLERLCLREPGNLHYLQALNDLTMGAQCA